MVPASARQSRAQRLLAQGLPLIVAAALALPACAVLQAAGGAGGPGGSLAGTGAPAVGAAAPEGAGGAGPAFTPSPAPSAAGRFAVAVVVLPATATLYVAAPRGKAPAHDSDVQLSAEVRFSDGTTGSAVQWRTSEGDRAFVGPEGGVRAGLEPGVVKVYAASADGRAEGFALITVRDDSAAEVAVD